MKSAESSSFIPVLPVIVDYGHAPFLWLADSPGERGFGGNLCDGRCRDASIPMSKASVAAWLRQKSIKTLTVTGPRESKRPGFYPATLAFLERLDDVCAEESRHCSAGDKEQE